MLPGRRPFAAATPAAPIAVFCVVAGAALVAALRLPATVTVLGLAMFGILHNVLEIRYVSGRFAAILTGRFLGLLVVLITGIMLCRLVPMLSWSAPAEILLGYAVLGVACWWGLRRRAPLLVAALAFLVLAAGGSLAFPAYHFVFLTHLHNVVPLFFLWEWARELRQGRAAFRATHVVWVLLIPALILAGTFDAWVGGDQNGAAAAFAGGGERLMAAYTPPAWLDTAFALRLLVVFAFLQTMHYVVWVWFMPRYARPATERFERRAGALRGRRAWLLGLAGGALLAVLFATDYAGGKTLYGAVASYHAYLEFPVLLALLAGAGDLTGERE
ncbi:hypothetical protein [Spirillospora sp. NPDC029432]|uniref:hypothetical protein n=1 Tax=Spirillospora sp. NPDC029432 TaxID=3154599 RepID=UPI00345630EE